MLSARVSLIQVWLDLPQIERMQQTARDQRGAEGDKQRVTCAGFSPKRLARVREVLERYVDCGLVPGAVAAFARHGEVHIEATGTLALEG